MSMIGGRPWPRAEAGAKTVRKQITMDLIAPP
jgi:hypothetical protein